VALAPELPRFAVKQMMRFVLDRTPANRLLSTALDTAPMRWLAQQVYFHRRGTNGLSFEEFEARLRAMQIADT
jgi:hypothetical protein